MVEAPLDENGQPKKPSLEKLLKLGVSPDALSFEDVGERRTLLCLAIEEAVKVDSYAKVDLLLDHKADPNLRSETGCYPLQLAVKHECFPLCRKLLQRKADVGQHDTKLVTPLHSAVHQDQAKIVQLLLLHKAKVNALDKLGQPPVFFANSRTVLTMLLEGNADLLQLNTKGQCALHLAALNGAYEAIAYLTEHDQMRHLVDLRDERGRTPLHMAAAKGHQAVVARLMDVGADGRAKTNNGQTAMSLADAHEHMSVAYYLYTRLTGGNSSSWSEMAHNPILLTLLAVMGVAFFVNRKLMWDFAWDLYYILTGR
mmetsp:Transcript_143/g.324  ORF Transcript_143/g.324 Transcript_143/m.324 type:complete len:313 (+) Transcript_143:41-979(+)